MVSLRKYIHASSLPIPQIFLSTLLRLPKLKLVNMCCGAVESFPSLITLAPKLVSLELQLYRQGIDSVDCLSVCPRTLPSENPLNPTVLPRLAEFRRAVINGLAHLLVVASDNLQVLYLDIPPWEREDLKKNWLDVALRQSKMVSDSLSLPSLKRLNVEDAFLSPDILKELLEAAPYLSHLALAILRKPELETSVRPLPLLKRL